MKIEIDQSGKVEHLNTDTVIVCANGESRAVRVTASTKRALMRYLKQGIIPSDQVKPLLFAIVVYILIKDLSPIIIYEIDEEYSGKEIVIAEVLGKLLRKRWKDKWGGEIRFKRIGKDSPAHQLAWRAHRFPRKYMVRKINQEEILKFFELKKPG